MQTNAEAVFAEINRAFDQNTALLLLPANITDEASKRIMTMWIVSHFYCTKTNIKEMVLKSSNGYQVRNIPVFIEKGNKPEDKYQDMVIEFDKDGKISDLTIALPQRQHAIIMDNSNDASDLRRVGAISGFIENFRTVYNRNDTAFLRTVFSDDALIITGKVLNKQQPTDYSDSTLTETQIEYVVQDKEHYLNNLQKVFSKSYTNIQFDEIAVKQHESDPNIYGVTFKQYWTSGDYHDEGWLFLLVDYSKGKEKPIMLERRWYPTIDPKTGKKIHYSTEDIFKLSDFPVSK
jgi:hypothetical protein